jgi:DNA-directed RNA polymerase alpha subunit
MTDKFRLNLKAIRAASRANMLEHIPQVARELGVPLAAVPIEDLHMTRRSRNLLANETVEFVGDLLDYTESSLLLVPNLGVQSAAEIMGAKDAFEHLTGRAPPAPLVAGEDAYA